MIDCPDGATLLGVVDSYEYLAVEWVYRREVGLGARDVGRESQTPSPKSQAPSPQLDYYCTRSAWPETPAAQLAARDQVIADLRSQVAELEVKLGQAGLGAWDVGLEEASDSKPQTPNPKSLVACPTCGKHMRPALLKRHLTTWHNDAGRRRKAPPPAIACDICGRLISPWQMGPHKKRAHGQAEIARPPAAPKVALVEDRGDWRCAMCSSDTHARSLSHPEVCVRCAKLTTSTNGVHV